MSNYKIWDRVEKLKGFPPEKWFEVWPRSKNETMVLIFKEGEDYDEVVFLEDLKASGYKGSTDNEIVESYINSQMSNIDLELELKKANERINTLSTALEELTLTVAGV